MRTKDILVEAFEKSRYKADSAITKSMMSPEQTRLLDVINGDCSVGNGEYYFTTMSKAPYLG